MPFISSPNITFCSAVSQGSNSANWNTMPRSWPQPRTSRPSTVTRPPDAVSSPMAMRSAVVLPQPDGPISATISPSLTLKLTRLSACTTCTAPSMRSVNCLEMSCSATSPIPSPILAPLLPHAHRHTLISPFALALFSDPRQRLLADARVDQLADVAGFRQLAERDHLLLQPDQVLDRDRHIGIDHAGLHARIVHVRRARIVGLGVGGLARHRDGLVAVRHRVAQRLDLRGDEMEHILAPLGERPAGHQRAEAHELGQHLAPLDQHAQL